MQPNYWEKYMRAIVLDHSEAATFSKSDQSAMIILVYLDDGVLALTANAQWLIKRISVASWEAYLSSSIWRRSTTVLYFAAAVCQVSECSRCNNAVCGCEAG